MAKEKDSNVRVSEQSPLKWADGQERTLIDRRIGKSAWKKTFRQYLERLSRQLDKLKIEEATISFNPAPSDRQDPGVALYFSKPRKEDYSWQVGLGIDSPMPTLDQINTAFRAKAMIHHPDKVAAGSGGDPKLYAQFDEYRKKAVAWIKGNAQSDREYCIAVDRCTETRWNVEAIRRILIAVATMDEYGNPGTLERTFRGFKVALPAHASSEASDVHKAVNA